MSTPEQRPSQFDQAPDSVSYRQTTTGAESDAPEVAATPPTSPHGQFSRPAGPLAEPNRRSTDSGAVGIRQYLAPGEPDSGATSADGAAPRPTPARTTGGRHHADDERESLRPAGGPSAREQSIGAVTDRPISAGPAHRPASSYPPADRPATGTYPADLDERSPAVSVAPGTADTSFREAGRGAALDRPEAPHLDERLVGLDRPNRPGRSFLGRRRSADGVDNPASSGLHQMIHSPRRISVVGMKGGVGKTTLSILTSTAIARAKQAPVLLLDSDTTYGSLMLRTGLAPRASAEDLARMGDPGDLRVLASAVSRTRDGVWVVPSGRTPAQSAAFGENSYVAAVRAVYRHFPVMLTDCGAGLAGPLMHRVISASHSLIIATAPSMDSLLASYNTLEWLGSIGYHELARRSIVAVSNVDPANPRVDLTEVRRRFAELAGAVIVIPSDPHLVPGSVLDYDALSERTRGAAEDLAGTVLAAALAAP